MKSTPEMRARIRELMTSPIDDYDRAVGCVLDDLEHMLMTRQDVASALPAKMRREEFEAVPLIASANDQQQTSVITLLIWIENEAARGLADGDARDALTAIKWKIKDHRLAEEK